MEAAATPGARARRPGLALWRKGGRPWGGATVTAGRDPGRVATPSSVDVLDPAGLLPCFVYPCISRFGLFRSERPFPGKRPGRSLCTVMPPLT